MYAKFKETSHSKFIKKSFRVLVDDHARVILKELTGVRGSDYINASYIDVRKFLN